jgi:hypothetical protein
MVGEEGRAQVTVGYRQATEEANETHPYFFSPLGVYGLPHINSKQFLAVMQVGDVVLNPFSLFLFSFDPTGTLLPYSSKKSSRANLCLSSSISSSMPIQYSYPNRNR